MGKIGASATAPARPAVMWTLWMTLWITMHEPRSRQAECALFGGLGAVMSLPATHDGHGIIRFPHGRDCIFFNF